MKQTTGRELLLYETVITMSFIWFDHFNTFLFFLFFGSQLAENATFLREIMGVASIYFSYCLIDELSGEKGEGRHHCDIVVPFGWLYWFGFSIRTIT